jgi:hypothetical protein
MRNNRKKSLKGLAVSQCKKKVTKREKEREGERGRESE